MNREQFTKKALHHSDDIGVFIASVVGLCGILHLPEKLDITADELAMGLGFGFTIVAFIRGRFERAYRTFLSGGRFTGPTTAEETFSQDESVPEAPTAAAAESSILPPPPAVGPKS